MSFVVATLAAWLVHRALPAPGGNVLPALLSGLFFVVVFYFVRRWFGELRPDV